MTNQEAIEIFKAHMESAKMTADFCEKTGRADVSYYKKNVESYKLAIAALETQEYEKWHPICPDDPDSFPNNSRFVLVSFSNLEVVEIARWRTDVEGGMFCHLDEDYSYSKYGMFVNAWKELPKRWTNESD